ncbi:hypothetical protein HOLleu_18195 [Holothuria leucospilota]|uniref:Uncharacterized protein n=1 Tax=Holothuria leucospilota TaxID=206669 RepID=A0A9Q1C2F2_HOLLE|nr:hypothetical protein HOLleu_18195 [Holothuria leucospilota]
MHFCTLHKRAIGSTWAFGPKFHKTRNRSLAKHHYNRPSTLLNINWRKSQLLAILHKMDPMVHLVPWTPTC